MDCALVSHLQYHRSVNGAHYDYNFHYVHVIASILRLWRVILVISVHRAANCGLCDASVLNSCRLLDVVLPLQPRPFNHAPASLHAATCIVVVGYDWMGWCTQFVASA